MIDGCKYHCIAIGNVHLFPWKILLMLQNFVSFFFSPNTSLFLPFSVQTVRENSVAFQFLICCRVSVKLYLRRISWLKSGAHKTINAFFWPRKSTLNIKASEKTVCISITVSMSVLILRSKTQSFTFDVACVL